MGKLIPALVLVGGGVSNNKNVQLHIAQLLNFAQVTATQTEVNDIAKMVYLDTVDSTAPRDQQAFVEYVRKNMRAKVGQTRDTSKDFWGTEYRIQWTERSFKISSAGPDRQFDTADDIMTGYTL